MSEKPPTAFIDDEGIGVIMGGVREFYIRWSEIRTVAVEVISYGGVTSEAFWWVEGSNPIEGSPAFFAPVELIANSELVNHYLSSLPNFDHAAFQRALEAEENCGEGVYQCWAFDK